MKRLVAILLSLSLVFSGLVFYNAGDAKAATATNVANGRNATTYTTSNANNSSEGFCYVNNGFTAINMCNETLTNGNNLLGKTATTSEVAVMVDLGANYDISNAKIYQGSTNNNYPDSYCKNYSIYYSTQTVDANNKGNITWNLAGTCNNGTIYSGAQRNSATDVSSNGDSITFSGTYTARSVKVVFDKNSCMGTGTVAGTVSVLSLQVFGVPAGQTVDPTQAPSDDGSIDGGDGVVDVLFIGNSFMYYNTSWEMFKGIANYHGHNVKVTAATNGGQYLTYQATAGNVLDAIAKGPYDIVVLQDKVGGGFNGSELAQGCNDIIPKIRQYSPNAKLAFYEPWPTKPNIQAQINDFTKGYINIAKTWNASLAPAGEGFYELYTKDNLDYYCSDNRHPQPLGTFNSASTIYYALFPQDAYKTYTESDHNYLNTLINNCVAYTDEGKLSSYNLATLNKINGYAYKYAHAVIPAVKGTGSYTTVRDGGVVANPTDGQTDPNVPTQQATTKSSTQAQTQAPTQAGGGDDTLYGSYTVNLAQGKKGYASSNDRNQTNPTPTQVNNLTDGNNTSYIVSHKNDTTPWFAEDLGSVQDINKINLVPGGDGAYASSYPINYEIQVASETTGVNSAAEIDSLTWKTVATVTGGTLNAKATTFPRQSARWIRVKVSSASATTCSLMELYVYQTNPSVLYGETETEATTNGNTNPGNSDDVLFIGNSMTYYNNLYKVVKGMAERKGHSINTEAATNGGQNIIFQSTADNVLNAIKKGGFEVVVLQDIVGGFDADKLQDGADRIIPIIKQYNPNAQIIFYEPWPTKDTISGANSKLPYFTNAYIKTAKSAGARLAPAGEAFYELYTDEKLDFYCADNKHPQPLGTFTSAATIYYTLYPDEAYGAFAAADQNYYDSLINSNVAYTNEGQQNTYSIDTLNKINAAGYKYAHAVAGPVAGNGKYTSVAGEFVDPDEIYNPNGLPTVTGTAVDASAFSAANGNIAIGKTSTASSGTASLGNNGATGDRWESTHGVDPQWYVIDLGKATSFDTVGFIWEGAYASKYYIQVSDDGSNWETVKPVKATSAQTVQVSLGQTYNKRYIRMMGVARGTGYGYSFYEMAVWNKSGQEVTNATTAQATTKQATTAEVTTKQTTTAEVTTKQATTAEVTTKQATTQATTKPSGTINPNITKPFGLTWAGANNLPFYFAWGAINGVDGYNVYVDGVYTQTVTGSSVNLDPALFADGDEHVVAVQTVQGGSYSEGEGLAYNKATGAMRSVKLGPDMNELKDEESSTVEQTTTKEATTAQATTKETTTAEVTTKQATTAEVTTKQATTAQVTTEEITTAQATTKQETTTAQTTTVQQTTTKQTTTAEVTTKQATTAQVTTKAPETQPATNESETASVKVVDETSNSGSSASVKKPAKVKIKKITKKKSAKKLVIKIKKVACKGYQVAVYKTKKNAKKNKKALVKKFVKKNKAKLVITHKKLKGKKGLFVRVRAYNKVNGLPAVYGAWSAIKKTK